MPPSRFPEELLRDSECSQVVAGTELEDLQENKEVWIIRVPRDIDVTSLDGIGIDLRNIQQDLPGEKKYEVVTSQVTMPSSSVVIPTSSAGKLECGLAVCGELLIKQVVDIGEVEVPEGVAGDEKVPFPTGLKQRWKPYGWKTPHIRPKRSKKTSKMKKTKMTKRT